MLGLLTPRHSGAFLLVAQVSKSVRCYVAEQSKNYDALQMQMMQQQ